MQKAKEVTQSCLFVVLREVTWSQEVNFSPATQQKVCIETEND